MTFHNLCREMNHSSERVDKGYIPIKTQRPSSSLHSITSQLTRGNEPCPHTHTQSLKSSLPTQFATYRQAITLSQLGKENSNYYC